MKEYWVVKVYYGGDGPMEECFRTDKKANDFYADRDYCDPPEKVIADTDRIVDWCEQRIISRTEHAICEGGDAK